MNELRKSWQFVNAITHDVWVGRVFGWKMEELTRSLHGGAPQVM